VARPRLKTALWQLSISIPEPAQEPVSALVETLFNRAPSIYVDEDTRKTIASLYLEKRSDWNSQKKSGLQRGLEWLRENGVLSGNCKIVLQKLQPQDWAESWKKHFKPIQIGGALLIKPSWSKLRTCKNQACVVLDPGLSFGTGQHATTSFCLRQMVERRREKSSQSFLDVGTGSGILAISAAKLGYMPVNAFDFDADCVRVAKANAEQNGVAKKIKIVRGDLTELPLKSKTRFDLVCANLIYDLLLSERERIMNRVAPDGALVLAGILKKQFSQVKTAYEKAGMLLTKTKIQKEWQSGEFVFRDSASH
jgi:ribosomal protein L11 methyltransferase